MAYLSQTASKPGMADRFLAGLAVLNARYAKYRVYRKTLDELARLSDRDLGDLGLNRATIRATAMEAAYGK